MNIGIEWLIVFFFAPSAFSNPRLVAISGGIGAILRSVLDCPQLPRINESLLTAVLYMLNHPQTRHYIRTDIDLEVSLKAAQEVSTHWPLGDVAVN